jgi:hypothetical protein
MRKILLALGAAALAIAAAATPAGAAPLTVTSPTLISTVHPFASGCGGATEGSVPGANFNYLDAEAEPWLAVSPTSSGDVAGFWQQDRWSNGGSHGLVAAVSHNGGPFAFSEPHFSICAGGTAANGGDFGRSSDPWVSWAPNGDLWSISLSFDATTTRNAVLAARMAHGTSSWSEPFTLKFDTSVAGVPVGNNFNDKESITADPTDASGNLVYAVWDRFVSPTENAPFPAFEHAHAFHQPVWFDRTTNGAAPSPSWETARQIFDPGTQNGTISNQIVVLPDGTLVDGFYLFKVHQQQGGNFIAVIRSTDRGLTWSKKAIIVSPDGAIGETDPEPIHCRPFITGNPLCTIVRSDGVIEDLAVDNSSAHHGRIYVTWQDHQDNPFGDDLILLSHSDDGGLTWSAPVKVNQTPSGTLTDQAFEPSVHVNSNGVVAVTYYDFRHDVAADGALTTDYWIVHSHDGGATWTEDHLAGPFDMHQAPYARGYFVGDYQGLDAQGRVFRNLFTLANPSVGSFPNPNPTDEFINSAF